MKLTCYTLENEEHLPKMIPGGPERDWMEAFGDRHPYRCLPLVIANTTGWELQSPYSFTAWWTGGPLKEDIQVRPDDDTPLDIVERFATSHFTKGVLTFHTGYLFRTEPGWDTWVGGAPNHVKDGIQALSGIVETDWLPFPFTMNWHFTRPGYVSWKKGDPFCFVMPVPHHSLDAMQPILKSIETDQDLKRQYEAWGQSRNKFLDNLENKDPETLKQGWQRHYFKGDLVSGDQRPEGQVHVNRRRLKAPVKE
jgi:hypothetical protein